MQAKRINCKNIDNALNVSVPVVIGEFGGQHTNGDVDEATIMTTTARA
ncbi:MAG: hypothetical protein ACLTCP_09510 [Ruminococcus bicirculans (ex Wegman et al. 2014)]